MASPAEQLVCTLPRDRQAGLRGDCRAWAHRASVLAMAVLGAAVLGGGTMAGCGPPETAASPGAQAAAPTPREPQSGPRETGPAAAEAVEAVAEYVLPFEPRANPFAPPDPKPNDRVAAAGPVHQTDVRLMGIMNDGDRAMAGVEIDGEQQIVFAGTRVGRESEAGDLRVVEIRDSEIVVEQSGKQWVVPLPHP